MILTYNSASSGNFFNHTGGSSIREITASSKTNIFRIISVGKAVPKISCVVVGVNQSQMCCLFGWIKLRKYQLGFSLYEKILGIFMIACYTTNSSDSP